MTIIGIILSLQFIIIAAYLLFKKYHPQAVLMICGLMMVGIGMLMNFSVPELNESTGSAFFDLFRRIQESMIGRLSGVGLMIMAIGGFVAYMKHIGASEALVYISMQPLSVMKKYPYLASILVIPIGQLLFICTPSATGLGLLLVASIYPVLVGLGVSRLTAVSVISACTVFDMGPASANTARAAELIGKSNVAYFIEDQLPVTIPATIVLMIIYYFSNKYFDKKEKTEKETVKKEDFKLNAPLIYAILPILPLILLIIFSRFIELFPDNPIILDTTTAIFISVTIAFVFELIRKRKAKEVFSSLKIFWEGMGKVFATVITLIVAAEIFSTGLISLGFIDGLVDISTHLGLGAVGIGILIAVIIFLASMLMGSGNASFFSFGPLVPDIATKLGVKAADMILPMQLASSMGRATSPIAGIIVAISEIAGVSAFDLAKRNLIPLVTGLIFILVYHSISI
ncbi:DcuC family C4-dicarboxylate transporter [Dysgonomonas hofstadii]|uniref:DcuC family C4-dicarboxylate transporter n=1 Tax=Dysgonomonas hofstadii TaxID=637886 RepID=A0A840CLE5_9BACT|nr:C4-dicarboxylate transporter DcuC [Dysgonomonas hofstadii]MBB4036810.1 DcuC family C4-dicarboxylate transporter [Dysgonomonas hofstadii]